MNEADMEALSRPLAEVRPILDAFCELHGFRHVDKQALGRYPRLRIHKPGEVTLWFDLWMELDDAGRRHEAPRSDLPYELSAGAYMDVADGSKYGKRTGKAMQCFRGKPIHEVASILEDELERVLRIVQEWHPRYLRDQGETFQLGG